MFFIFSKVLGYLTQPVVLIVLLVLLGFVIKKEKWKKRFFYSAFFSLLFFSNPFFINVVLYQWELPTKPYIEIKSYKVGVVLTGIANTNSNAPNDRVYFSHSADRIVHAYELYQSGKIKKILVTGGDGSLVNKKFKEAFELQKFLLRVGVPQEDILLDTIADNTYENAIESMKILNQQNISQDETIVITSALHMRRALACFHKQNFYPDYFTCDFKARTFRATPDAWLIPSVDAIHNWQRLLKEWVGFVAYQAMGYI